MRGARVQMPPPPGYRPRTDGLTTGAVVVVFVVGLSMIAVLENNLLSGGSATTPESRAAVGGATRKPDPKRTGAQRPRTAPPAPPVQTLTKNVGELTLQLRGPAARRSYGGDKAPLTGASRFSADRTWALGTVAIPVPDDSLATPHVSLYLAHWSGGKWRIALSGTAEFTRLLAQVPNAMMPADERRLLVRYSTVSGGADAQPTGLMLPWRVGASWSMDAKAGGRGPLETVSFRGGDGIVAAAGPGRLYRFCAVAPGRGLVMVIHPNGVASTYYHLTGVPAVRDGALVPRGTRLGRVGVDRPCGGVPVDQPQVRFALRRGNDDIPFAGVQLGGWVFRQRAQPLVGWAERGEKQVLPGERLRNFGPVAPPDPPPADDPPGRDGPQVTPSPKEKQERTTSGDPQQ
jgi:LasA protease